MGGYRIVEVLFIRRRVPWEGRGSSGVYWE